MLLFHLLSSLPPGYNLNVIQKKQYLLYKDLIVSDNYHLPLHASPAPHVGITERAALV